MVSKSQSQDADAWRQEYSEEVMARLFYWARDRVTSVVVNGQASGDDLGDLGRHKVLGAFVSFKWHGRLRSCMGYVSENVDLGVALAHASVSAAREDPRFPPISSREFYELDMEVWALQNLQPVAGRGAARRESIVIGRDGLQIVGRGRRGLLLPSVPVEAGWDLDDYLAGICDKAGLSRDAWRADDVQLFSFAGVSYKKPFVYNASRNPLLSKVLEEQKRSHDVDATAQSQTSYSISPSLFQWQAPISSLFSNRRNSETSSRKSERPCAVAGMFYPSSAREQDAMLASFEQSEPFDGKREEYYAALVPHAGWIYSGALASLTYRHITEPETVVVFAPKHRREGANFALMPDENWNYSAGQVPNDLQWLECMKRHIPEFVEDRLAHRSEHSIEVQIPMLARYFPNAKVVGALVGYASREELLQISQKLADTLTDWIEQGRKRPLLVISSDMNHYASEESTRAIDRKVTDALETLDPDLFLRTVRDNQASMCGVLPAYAVICALRMRGELNRALRVGYATSGATSGDFERVVGYAGYLLR